MNVLVGWLRALGRPSAWVLVYAWHPLVVVELAGSGHLDAVAGQKGEGPAKVRHFEREMLGAVGPDVELRVTALGRQRRRARHLDRIHAGE